MKNRCSIISGGKFSSLKNLNKDDYIIACDKGYQYAIENNITPNLFIGDFDSYHGEVSKETNILELPVEKDDTDTHKAISYAVENGYNEISIYCALGNRLDHALGNIQSASFAASQNAMVHIFDDETIIHIFTNNELTVNKIEGFSFSVISLTDKCEGVTINGAKWELEKSTITNTFPIGISNEWVNNIKISVKEGIIMVILSKI